MKNQQEQQFYDALQDVFTGVHIQGTGGYVNLLHIKHKYYSFVLKQFKKEIDGDPVISSFNKGDKEDFFRYLYTFFERYFSKCGSVYFTKTPAWQKVYERIYTSDKDVVLFWKTNMLYYVKSDILFQTTLLKVEDENGNGYVFKFDVGTLAQKQNNEKKELLFSLDKKETNITQLHDKKSGNITYVISVGYKSGKVKSDAEIISQKSNIPVEIVEKAIERFKRQTTVDFFINKNAKVFLEEQLDLFLNQKLLELDSQFDQQRLGQIKAVKRYALKLISFISQFENELVYIWNKPKFVRKSNYVISLDKLSDDLIEKIRNHCGLKGQIEEWKALKMVDNNFTFSPMDLMDKPHLPIDTKFFKDLELEILNRFEHLDEALNGRLIKSENYQALKTMQNRYQGQIHCIYIDPPFNTGSDFPYMDDYQDSTWLTLMNDRVDLAKNLLNKKGSMFLHLDHYAEHRGRELMDLIFDSNNFVNNLSWGYRSGGQSEKKALPYKHDSILFYAKDKENLALNLIKERQYYEKNFMDCKKDSSGRYYKDTTLRDTFEGEIYDTDNNVTYNVRKVLNLSDEFYSFKNSQKPEGLIHLLTTLSNIEPNGYVCDFFAGSGTSMAVSHKLGYKFVGIEMGEHFYEHYMDTIQYKDSETNRKDIQEKFVVLETEIEKGKIIAQVKKVGLLGRMKEVIACCGAHEPCGITKDVKWQGGGFFKYYELEQYEDVLRKASYNPETEPYSDDVFNKYVFCSDNKFADVIKVKDKDIDLDFSKLYDDIDFPETISLLMGAPIMKITEDAVLLQGMEKPIKYNVKNMLNDEEKMEFVQMLKPLLWWGEEDR